MTEVFALCSGSPTDQGTVRWRRHMTGTREMCEQFAQKLRHPVPNGPEVNPGKVEIISLERWLELKAQGLVSG